MNKKPNFNELISVSILESSDDSIFVIDTDGIILNLNKSTARRLGKSRESMIGTPIKSHIPDHLFKSRWKHFKKAFKIKKSVYFEDERDGIYFHHSIYPIFEQGKVEKLAIFSRDITKIKITENNLKEAHNKLEATLNALPDLMFEVDQEGRFYDYYSHDPELLYSSPDTFLGKKVTEVLPPDVSHIILGAISKAAQKGRHTGTKISLELPSGQKWFELSISKKTTKLDDPKLFVVLVHDITKIIENEEALSHALLYNRSLIEASLDPLVTISPDGKITDVNEATVRITGSSRDELIGTDFSDYFTNPQEAQAGYEKVFREGQVKDYPLKIQHKNGQINSVLYNASVYHAEDGKVIGVFAAARDITEKKKVEKALKESESRYRSIIETAQEGVWLLDENANTTYVNQAMAEMLGYTIDEMIGEPLFNFMDDEGKIDAAKKMEKRRDGVKEVHDFRFLHKNGSDVWTIISTNPFFDKNEGFIGVLGMLNDITDRKMAEEEIKNQITLTNSINIVLKNSIKAENDVEVALNFLKIAEEITSSKFGFIKEINEQGKVDILTISDPGWKECQIPQSEAIKMLSGREIVSYWGRVLTEGKSQIVNHPEYDPDSVGVPKGHPPIKTFLGVPLLRGGKSIGLIGLANKEEGYNHVDQKKIETLAVAFIESLNAKRADEQIKKSLKDKEILLKEIHHRVKNNLMIISSLLNLQSGYIKDTESQDIFKESQNRARSMALIHERLYQSTDQKKINFGDYIQTLSKELFRAYVADSRLIELDIDVEDIMLDINTTIPLGLILNELITNSLKHAFPEGTSGKVHVDLHLKDDHYEITVKDNGIGFPENIDYENTDTLGLKLVNSLTGQIDGEIDMEHGEGTTFKIRFVESKL
jgi:PAS domain S-box-containing protein